MNRPCVTKATCLITDLESIPLLGMDWNGFPEEFLEELYVKLSEKGGIELRKAVVKVLGTVQR